MNEKLQYAEMLEIPVNTCNITYKPAKKRLFSKKKKVNAERVKEQVIDKVNNSEEVIETPVVEDVQEDNLQLETEGQQPQIEQQQMELDIPTEEFSQEVADGAETKTATISSKSKRRKFSIVGVQIAVIVALFAVIFVTNALNSNSGINVFLKGVFGASSSQSVDMREYDDFTPVFSNVDGMTLENGVITFSGEGSVYSPCDGKIASVTKTSDGTYDVEIYHSQNFKSVFNGLEHVYAEVGNQVYSNIPVGYSSAGDVKMCFFESDGSAITDFTLNGSNVVWA